MGIEPELVERFRADLRLVWPQMDMTDRHHPLAVAVSGGADSMALMALAHAALPGRVHAVTVDHGLRPESRDEARHVAQVCEGLSVPHKILDVTVQSGNLQSEARAARYGAMASWCVEALGPFAALATAHHADDQVETLAMRLNRASGVAGLSGIRARRALFPGPDQHVDLIRPLLSWRHDELVGLLERAGIAWIEDPSNSDPRFDRVRIRAALREAEWIDPNTWTQSAAFIAEAADAITLFATREFGAQVEWEDDCAIYRPSSCGLVAVEVLEMIFNRMGASASRAELARMEARLGRDQNANLAGILGVVTKDHDEEDNPSPVWTLCPEPPRRTA